MQKVETPLEKLGGCLRIACKDQRSSYSEFYFECRCIPSEHNGRPEIVVKESSQISFR